MVQGQPYYQLKGQSLDDSPLSPLSKHSQWNTFSRKVHSTFYCIAIWIYECYLKKKLWEIHCLDIFFANTLNLPLFQAQLAWRSGGVLVEVLNDMLLYTKINLLIPPVQSKATARHERGADPWLWWPATFSAQRRKRNIETMIKSEKHYQEIVTAIVINTKIQQWEPERSLN